MTLRKTFESLRKPSMGGLVPRSLLTKPTSISIPNENTLNTGTVTIVQADNLTGRDRDVMIKTCFNVKLNIVASGLDALPLHRAIVKHVDLNGTVLSVAGPQVELRVSENGEHLFFKAGVLYVDAFVFTRRAFKYVIFDSTCLTCVFGLLRKSGYLHVDFDAPERSLYRFFLEHKEDWNIKEVGVSAKVESLVEAEKRRRKQREAEVSEERTQKKLSKPETEKRTRSNPSVELTSLSDGEKEPSETEVLETPAPFEPPLKYTLRNGKTFSVTFNDFKTLYNNDWINDTIIDFFLAYDIDRALATGRIGEKSVYAFSLFFFSKMTHSLAGEPDYYGNIRRWLSKVDLMAHDAIVIPINENLHWYCCIIRGLPKLLKVALRMRMPPYLDPDYATLKSFPCEVHIIDSLRHQHPDIKVPLRRVISDYCVEHHGVPIPTSLIKFLHAYVPQQRNFNDCGLHVIFNVQKWLQDSKACERAWKKPVRMQKSFFNAAERSELRRTLIDLLLRLHEEQPLEQRRDADSDDEIEEIGYLGGSGGELAKALEPEDEVIFENAATKLEAPVKQAGAESVSSESVRESVEVIGQAQSELPGRFRQHEPQIVFAEQDEATQPMASKPLAALIEKVSRDKDPANAARAPEAPPAKTYVVDVEPGNPDAAAPEREPRFFRTLDPKARATLGSFLRVEHGDVRRACLQMRFTPAVARLVNDLCDPGRRLSRRQVAEAAPLIGRLNESEPLLAHYYGLAAQLRELLRERPQPLSEPFEIDDSFSLSEGELNQSVGELRLGLQRNEHGRRPAENDKLHLKRRRVFGE